MTYIPLFWDPHDCDAWHGPDCSKIMILGFRVFTQDAADFVFDQLYDIIA